MFSEILDLTYCISQSPIIWIILKLMEHIHFYLLVRTLLTAGYEYRTIYHSFDVCMSE